MRLEITEEHLKQGEPKSAFRCPIALVAREALKGQDATPSAHNNAYREERWPPNPHLKVGRWFDDGTIRYKYYLLKTAGAEKSPLARMRLSNWMHEYDSGRKVNPIVVEAEELENELETTS